MVHDRARPWCPVLMVHDPVLMVHGRARPCTTVHPAAFFIWRRVRVNPLELTCAGGGEGELRQALRVAHADLPCWPALHHFKQRHQFRHHFQCYDVGTGQHLVTETRQ